MQILMPDGKIDRIERLQAVSALSGDDWLDLLQMSWRDYRRFQLGQSDLSASAMQRISSFFNLGHLDLEHTDPDFEQLTIRFHSVPKELPEEFMVAAHGRRRTTITSLEFLEKHFGWRLRHDILQRFQIDESSLRDAFAPISIRFMSQMCSYLSRRQFGRDDFFQMGRYSLHGNRVSIIGSLLAECGSLEELFDRYFNQLSVLFEANCHYSYLAKSAFSGVITCRSVPDVAKELSVRNVGSAEICEMKQGIYASLPGYLGYNDAQIVHTQCEHRGDPACVSTVDLSRCRIISTPDLSAANF